MWSDLKREQLVFKTAVGEVKIVCMTVKLINFREGTLFMGELFHQRLRLTTQHFALTNNSHHFSVLVRLIKVSRWFLKGRSKQTKEHKDHSDYLESFQTICECLS